MIVGLTGGLGCGKSEVLKIIREYGIDVISADDVVHELLRSPDIKSKLKEAFGEGIFDESGEVNRRILANIVFKNKEKLEFLNSLIHPFVREIIRFRIGESRRQGEDLVVEIPLLLEAGDPYEVDVIVVVSAPINLILERLKNFRGWTEEEIKDRMKSQLPLEEKEKRAHYVVYNDGSLEELKEKVKLLIEKLKLRPKKRYYS
ncbi:MAG: dephospho-CoA kinase [Synergistetes bacterium]|nr:dephospho-CoA kinase [Synergistota bacterium]MCX8127320.1 dephospho-CoA kinase [Synergistota bacterium]MDW8191793.1 dephospho-CoA kinase [Synergistota bacterium]